MKKNLMHFVAFIILFGFVIYFSGESFAISVEAKEKRIAKIISELFILSEKVEKNPALKKDVELNKRAQALNDEAQALIKELIGETQVNQDDIIADIIKKFAPQYLDKVLARKTKNQVAVAMSRLRSIKTALEIYYLDNNSYPTTAEGLSVLTRTEARKMPYIQERDLIDPWGNPVIYKLLGPQQFILKSAGPDGKEGTADDVELK